MDYSTLTRLFILVVQGLLLSGVSGRDPKKTVYMSRVLDCDTALYDDRLSEGDRYKVKSDQHIPAGLRQWRSRKRVSYCPVSFDFGSRLVAVVVDMWRCDKGVRDNDASLAIYGDCRRDNSSTNLLKWVNCTLSDELHAVTVYSPDSCVSILFNRGSRSGPQFELTIIARYERFPAYKIAAIITSSIVLLMLGVKLLCIVSGYDRRLPNIPLNTDGHTNSTNDVTRQVIQVDDTQGSLNDVFCDEPTSSSRPPGHRPTHRVVSVTRSVSSARSSHGSMTATDISPAPDLDLDFLELGTPRLKRYPSARAANIFSHK